MQGWKPVDSQGLPGVKVAHEGDELPKENDKAAVVGSLLYLSTKSRPDIS
jgi:hypothetical protein